MKRVVIVGGSGMVGGYALRYALEHPNVERVTSVGRINLGISHSKLTEVRAMVDVSVRETGKRESLVFENRDIRAMANSALTHDPA
jgi:N-acetyl-gamma-glutamylphosphate reductase